MDAGHEDETDSSDPSDPDPCDLLEADRDGVALWLDAAEGIVADDEGRVQQWDDRSSHQHVATPVGLAPDWPLLVTSADGFPAVRFGVVEGGPLVRRLVVPDHASLQFGTDSFAIIVVLRHHTPTNVPEPEMEHGGIFLKSCNCAGYVGPQLFANDVWPRHLQTGAPVSGFALGLAARTDYSTQTLLSGFNDDELHVVVAKRIRDEISIEVDGQPHTSAVVSSTLDVSTPGVPVTIGANGFVDLQALEGEIYEMIVLTGTATLRAGTRAECLARSYGIRE
jgi:hypothetical protein